MALKDITLGQYFPGNTVIHRLDPRTKLLFTVLYIVALFSAKGIAAYAVLFAVLCACIAISKIQPKTILRGMKPILFIIVLTAVLNIFYTPGTPIWQWKFLKITVEGLWAAFFMVLRISFLITCTFMLTYTTSPIMLTDGLERLLGPLKKLHVPVHELSMIMSIALRFIPPLIEETAETYTANFRTTSSIPCDRIPLAVNTRLPDDIVVVKATEVPEDFNAIGSCIKKEYTYRIYNSRLGNAFYVDRAWFYPKYLDETVMQRAADCFVGTHDFSAVRAVGTDVRSPVRTVHYFNISRNDELIECRVCANGFLYNMVRAMVGTCVYAAEGKFAPEEVSAILESKNRTAAGPTVPPGGLYMTKLWYNEDVL